MFIRFLTPFRTKCLPDLREEATTSLPKVNLAPDSDVVYTNITVTGTFMGHQIFEDAYNQVTSA
ncbi:unnamed protein product [Aureobasidium pullulans]|nr:unnamed protein product [Aureobasidium pullulans]